MYLSSYNLALCLVPFALASNGCDSKESCYKDLEAYCRVAYPVEPISVTQTESAYVTETTTTTTTETFVGIKGGRIKASVSLVPLHIAQPSAAQITPPAKAFNMKPDAMIKNLCSCIQSPTTTIVATETTFFTSTITETSTAYEVYCHKGCFRNAEYCDTSSPPTSDPDDHPAGVCRPTGECDDNDDCYTKKGKRKCRCLQDNSAPDISRGYCISYSALDCDDLDENAQACEDSIVCKEDYVCLDVCPKESDTKFCIKPRSYGSFCEVADGVFGKEGGVMGQWPMHFGL